MVKLGLEEAAEGGGSRENAVFVGVEAPSELFSERDDEGVKVIGEKGATGEGEGAAE